jgi:hypothetical protein
VRLLIDTDILIWWLADDCKLAKSARGIIANPDNGFRQRSVALGDFHQSRASRIGKANHAEL